MIQELSDNHSSRGILDDILLLKWSDQVRAECFMGVGTVCFLEDLIKL